MGNKQDRASLPEGHRNRLSPGEARFARFATSDPEEDAKVESFSRSSSSFRRQSVSGPSVSEAKLACWQAPVHKKSADETRAIKFAIENSESLQVLFGHLSSAALDTVVGAMFGRDVQAGEKIIEQDADGDYFYIVHSGSFEVFVEREGCAERELVMKARSGMSFGEIGLMYNAPREASVVCTEAGRLWCLDRECFQMVVTTTENTRIHKYDGFLRNVQLLQGLTKYERDQLCDILTSQEFKSGEDIITQGSEGDAVYFLYEGECKAYISGDHGEVEVHSYQTPGECFGEVALLTKEPRRASVRACPGGCIVLKLRGEDIDLSIGPIRERLEAQMQKYKSYEDYAV